MTYKNLTFYNHNYQGCLCKTITSKRIKQEIPAWSGFDGLEKFFPTVMWFFYLKILLVEIWLTLATWSKSTISNHHHQMFKKKIDFFQKSLYKIFRMKYIMVQTPQETMEPLSKHEFFSF